MLNKKSIIVFILIFIFWVRESFEVVFPNYGGEINISLYMFNGNFDPLWHTTAEEIELDKLLYDSLCEIDDKGKIVKLLLNSSEMIGDIWYFELKQDVLFYPFKSFLSAYEIKNLLSYCKNTKNPYSYLLEEIDTIEVIDTYKFFIKLKKADESFGEKLCHPAFSIVRRWKDETNNEAIAGIGPYKIKKEDKSGVIRLIANDYYYAGKPFINAINLSSFEEINPIFNYVRGATQVLSLVGRNISNVEKTISKGEIIKCKKPLLIFMILNPLKEPTKNEYFRNWLATKLDRDELLKSIFDNRGEPIYTLFMGKKGINKQIQKHNISKEEGRGIKIDLLVLSGDIVSYKVAERLQAVLIAEGYEADIKKQDMRSFFNSQSEWNYNIIVATTMKYYNDDNVNVEMIASNYSGLRKFAGKYLEKSQREFENYLLENNILIPLIRLDRYYAISSKLQFYFNDFYSISSLKDAWLGLE